MSRGCSLNDSWAAEVTIQDLGSIGELVAAIATIATLAYLAIQIRSSTLVSKSEANRASRVEATANVRLIAGDEDLARILLAGIADPESLGPADALRFRFLLGLFIGLFIGPISQAYREWHLGIAEEAEVIDRLQISRSILQTPGGKWYWRQQSADYDPEFRQYLESYFE